MFGPPVKFINMKTNPSPKWKKPQDLPTVHQPLINNMRAANISPATFTPPVKDRINNTIDYPSPITCSQAKKDVLIKIKADQDKIPFGWMPHLSETTLLAQERELCRTIAPRSDHFCRNLMLLVAGMAGVIFYQLLKACIARESPTNPLVLS